MKDSQSKRLMALAFFCVVFVSLSTIIYTLPLNSSFQLDDEPNFYGLTFVYSFQTALAYIIDGPAGLRWLSYASYLPHIDAWKAGSAFPFKLVNLLIHSFNAGLLFFCTLTLIKQRNFGLAPAWHKAISLLVATLWFAHPVHVNTVLYSVQRMTLIAGTFTFIGIVFHLRYLASIAAYGNRRLSFLQWFFYSVVLAFITCLGILGKENAILLPAFALLLVVYTQHLQLFRRWQWLLTYIAPFVLLIAYLIINNRLNHAGRDFDMVERLLSQVVILQEYLFKLLIPNTFSFSLYYDGFAPVRNMSDPRFIQATAIWLAIFALAWRLRFIAPAFGFGLLWFLIGHSLEGSIIPLELYFDHRNYLPLVGIVLAVVISAVQLWQFALQQGKKLFLYLLGLCFVLLLSNLMAILYYDASIWQSKTRYEQEQMLKRPNSLRAKQGYIETLFAEGKLPQAVHALEVINEQFGVYATHVIFQAVAACLANEDEKIDHRRILADLPTMPSDRSADSAVKALYDMAEQQECDSMTWSMFRQYVHALLNNPRMASHYHNFSLYLTHSLIEENNYAEALKQSFVLQENQRTQQYWFLQINLAIFLEDKKQAQSLYEGMMQSKNVHHRLYKDDIEAYKKKIEAMP